MQTNFEHFFEFFSAASLHSSWRAIVFDAFTALPLEYVKTLANHEDWLPGRENLLNAFSLPLENLTTILLGESPYPRITSANGYAFWDGAVGNLWSLTGFSKTVNRATSLRNLLKMLLVIDCQLTENDVTQQAIAKIDKHAYVQTIDELFANFINQGFLLLNASLSLSQIPKAKEAKYWRPFMQKLMMGISKVKPGCHLLLFGNFANDLFDNTITQHFNTIRSEHPYNISFINNRQIQQFFKPMQLLMR